MKSLRFQETVVRTIDTHFNLGTLCEYQIIKPRKYRVDFYVYDIQLAIECEGGTYSRGRHVRATGYWKDVEKYNLLAIHGIHVLRYSVQQMEDKLYIKDIEGFIKLKTLRENKALPDDRTFDEIMENICE